MNVDTILKISKEYEKDFLNGNYEIIDVVTRNVKTGKFAPHAGIEIKNKERIQKGTINKLDSKSVLIGVGITTAVVIVGKIIKVVIKKQKEKPTIQIPNCSIEFNNEFKEYLKDAQKGIINKEKINKLICLLNEIEKSQSEDVKIDFSTKELKNLIKDIYDFTTEIAKSNKIPTSKLKIPTDDGKTNILYLKDYFLVQKSIVEKENA